MNKRIVIIIGIATLLACGTMIVTAQSGNGTRPPQPGSIKPPPPPPCDEPFDR